MASFGPSRNTKSHRAANTVSSYRVVSPDTATSQGSVRVIQIPTETSYILGVSQDQANGTDAALPVAFFGYCKAAAGASVSAGALLTFATSTGYVIEQANGTIATLSANTVGVLLPKLVGVALSTGAATDAVIEIVLNVNNFRIRVA